jgi:hypothetical protein
MDERHRTAEFPDGELRNARKSNLNLVHVGHVSKIIELAIRAQRQSGNGAPPFLAKQLAGTMLRSIRDATAAASCKRDKTQPPWHLSRPAEMPQSASSKIEIREPMTSSSEGSALSTQDVGNASAFWRLMNTAHSFSATQSATPSTFGTHECKPQNVLKSLFLFYNFMVLPEGIELSTSPLPTAGRGTPGNAMG